MFDIGFLELCLLFIVGLLVLGPERLPRVARTMGGYMRKARSTWSNMRVEIERELAAEDLKKNLKEADEAVSELKRLGEPIDGQPKPREAAPADDEAAEPEPRQDTDDGKV